MYTYVLYTLFNVLGWAPCSVQMMQSLYEVSLGVEDVCCIAAEDMLVMKETKAMMIVSSIQSQTGCVIGMTKDEVTGCVSFAISGMSDQIPEVKASIIASFGRKFSQDMKVPSKYHRLVRRFLLYFNCWFLLCHPTTHYFTLMFKGIVLLGAVYT